MCSEGFLLTTVSCWLESSPLKSFAQVTTRAGQIAIAHHGESLMKAAKTGGGCQCHGQSVSDLMCSFALLC
ncbi:hypothetical protein K402DRAFT_81453 [Aulographum hederae CBS 113979]|uniref:Uncharacterized protein n=1 Tax=Aulographum hederae CBS 113979 TaxID=1176131 RepID=A0A6G1H0I0_9PEZI|nr:hypothetical protein K402DRAFT_81453 [Aulographum hederae CBS 113979]